MVSSTLHADRCSPRPNGACPTALYKADALTQQPRAPDSGSLSSPSMPSRVQAPIQLLRKSPAVDATRSSQARTRLGQLVLAKHALKGVPPRRVANHRLAPAETERKREWIWGTGMLGVAVWAGPLSVCAARHRLANVQAVLCIGQQLGGRAGALDWAVRCQRAPLLDTRGTSHT